MINALLGGKFLEDGILPTTNDISVLKFADSQEVEGVTQNQDGFYVRMAPVVIMETGLNLYLRLHMLVSF